MKPYLLDEDVALIRDLIKDKEVKLAGLGPKLGDAMSRSGSFPASNPEYAAVHLEMKNVENKLGYLKDILNKYRVVNKSDIDENVINTYSLVELKDQEAGSIVKYYICPAELESKCADGFLAASPESPVGATLLGHKTGDLVNIVLPTGQKSYKVISNTKKY
jgi:transcription elongation factor GreA